MKLYSYFRSSAAYRVRIALNLKQLDYDLLPVNLLQSEQTSEAYRQINAQGLVPALEDNGQILTQSLAMLEWLEEICPEPSLLPGTPWEKAQIRSQAYAVSCDIHPVNNLRILKYLQGELGVDDQTKERWYHHWIETGFDALEAQLEASPYCVGSTPTLADVCLIPQVYNALRFKVPMEKYPKILSVYEHCNQSDAFLKASPEQQPDCP